MKNFLDYIKENNDWYLVKIGDDYFAERIVKLPHYEKPQKRIFRDFNGKEMSLGKDETFAKEWIKTKNEIDKI